MRTFSSTGSGMAFLMALVILAVTTLLAGEMADRATLGYRVTEVHLSLPPPGEGLDLSPAHLGLYPDDSPVLRLIRDRPDAVPRVLPLRPGLDLKVDRGEDFQSLYRYRLFPGDGLTGAGFSLAVAMEGKSTFLVDRVGGGRIDLDPARIPVPDGPLKVDDCNPKAGGAERLWIGLKDMFRKLFGQHGWTLAIGGNVACPGRWPLSDVALGSLRLDVTDDGEVWIDAGRFPGLVRHQRPLPVELPAVKRLMVGPTLFEMEMNGGDLILHARTGRPLLSDPLAGDGLRFEGPGTLLERPGTLAALIALANDPLQPLLAGLLFLVITGGLYLAWRAELPVLWHHGAALWLLCLGAQAVYGVVRSGTDDPLFWMGVAGMAAAFATLCLAIGGWLRGAGGLVWCLLLFMAAVGLLAQGQMVAGGRAEGAVGILVRHTALGVAGSALAFCLLSLVPFAPQMRVLEGFTLDMVAYDWKRAPLVWLIFVVGVAALILVALGSERGVASIQPAEFVKMAVAVITAALAAALGRLLREGGREMSRLRLASWCVTWILLFIGLACAFLAVSDMSPLLTLGFILLGGWAGLLLHALAAHRESRNFGPLGWVLLLPGVVLAAALSFGLFSNPQPLLEMLGEVGGGRFDTWFDPYYNQIGGAQLLDAWNAIRTAPLLPDPGEWFGPNGVERRIAAVHHDFVGAFVIARFGILLAAALAAAQAAIVVVLMLAGLQLVWAPPAHGTAPDGGLLLGHLCLGMATALGMQWLVGWANPLGLLPVMGQPMSWIAYANFHTLCFGVPALWVGLMAQRAAREA